MTISQLALAAPVSAETPALAPLLKAAGDPLRLGVLRVLARDSFGVLELCRIMDAKQSGMSHHLKVLADAGLVSSRREGNSIYYRRARLVPDHPLNELLRVLFDTLDRQPLPDPLARRLEAIQGERARASRQFFADNAHKFREQQDLIASYPVYGEQVTQLLVDTPLDSRRLALEVGPGEGEFLPVLASRFERVLALDNAPGMLERARLHLDGKGLDNIEFVRDDVRHLARYQLAADCIVVNMVLHHTPSPAEIFLELGRSLAPGGVLLITDLCRHEQDWARQACGDLWQGFEPEDFGRWAGDAGLSEGQSIYFALRNGFQVQIRQFFNDQ